MSQTGVVSWSQTAATNASADSTVNYNEGQAPSSLNDSARAAMASVAKWRDDITGVNVTGGSGTAYTLTSNQLFGSNATGYTVQFTPGTSNTGAVTLSIDSQTAQPLRFLTGVDLPSGVLISGSLYQATYRSATSEWLLHSFNSTIYSIPIGGIIDFAGSTTPNGSFVFPAGQAISRTTYATCFALLGTTYGSGDGSTTFNVPDLTGRTVAMKEASAARLTATYFGGNSTTLGATGGLESETLTLAQLPTGISVTITPSGTIPVSSGAISSLQTSSSATTNITPANSNGNWNGVSSLTGTSNNTSGSPHNIVQPTIILNKILRVI